MTLHGGSMVATMSSDEIVVTSPFDGSEIGRVPLSTADDVDRAVATAKLALRAGPLPRWKRAEILDTAARLLGEREEEFARTIAAEAAKPIRTARAEAQRAVGAFSSPLPRPAHSPARWSRSAIAAGRARSAS